METKENRGIEIKEVLRFTDVSYAIHWNTRTMIVHINQFTKDVLKQSFPCRIEKG